MRYGVTNQAHAPKNQEHAQRRCAARQHQAAKQGSAHEDELLKRLPEMSGRKHQATHVWGC
ncbi:hypothetical protein D3C76_1609410 [compost metagenome]